MCDQNGVPLRATSGPEPQYTGTQFEDFAVRDAPSVFLQGRWNLH